MSADEPLEPWEQVQADRKAAIERQTDEEKNREIQRMEWDLYLDRMLEERAKVRA
jgi:hypothetical protein